MARKPRILSETGKYHIILRGNNQQNLFCEDQDYYFFLNRMKKYALEVNIKIYAYCLMTNHVHILLGNAKDNLSLFVQKLANSYVFFFNHKYERTGHLFQGRYKSEIIDTDEYFKTVFRYILQNPDKANIGHYKTYKWNSYKAIKNSSSFPLDSNYTLSLFGTSDRLFEFLELLPKTNGMEYENKFVINDSLGLQIIKSLFHIKSPYNLNRLDIEEQKIKIKILKQKGLSVNQIARLTGIGKYLIKTA